MSAEQIVLHAEVRDTIGKEWAKKARKDGRLPGVIYGAAKDAIAISIDAHEFLLARNAAHGDQVLIDLELSTGGKEQVFIKELQREPVSDQIIHVDFLRVDPAKPVALPIRVYQIGGIPEGVKLGGMLERLRYTVMVKALPANIPPHIKVNLSGMNLADSIYVSDLATMDNVEFLDDPKTVIFTIAAKGKAAKEALAASEAEGEAAPAASASA